MITTKTGDQGKTTCGNQRVDKDDLLVETIGEIDELESVLELVNIDEKILSDLRGIMGEIGGGKKFSIFNFQFSIEMMEKEIEDEKINLEKFLNFKTEKAKELNWTRTVCRRVERRLVSLNKERKIRNEILIYFNRLSDYLFIKAVKEN
jgi:cob(I)alamin adenosyltransferase